MPELHLFGYGSLLFKAPFEYSSWTPCVVKGFRRVFFQGSTDHRGTVAQPGRVVTLERDSEAICGGVLFRVPEHCAVEVLTALDIREKGGYEQHLVSCYDAAGNIISNDALCYIAVQGNFEYLGSAPLSDIARQVAEASGPSGHNSEYVIKLAECLRLLGFEDEHVFAVESEIRRLTQTHHSTLTEVPLHASRLNV